MSKYLVDTNIFLEVLFDQEKQNSCIEFLENNPNLHISDFSLHSIGVVSFRKGLETAFKDFLDDALPNLRVISLPSPLLSNLIDARERFNFDFDDAYQYCTAKKFNLIIVTMDKDFKVLNSDEVSFL